MKVSILLVTIPWCILPAIASEALVIPVGTAPDLDGEVREQEWSDTAEVQLSIENELTVNVRIKHDDTHLYCAFSFTDNAGRSLVFPEILIDPDYDQSSRWAPDDWWFHVSGTDCEASGTFSDYSNCKADHPDWKGIPNYELVESPPPLEGIEIAIALGKIGIVTDQVFGVAFTVELVPDKRALWPETAVVRTPSTWGAAVLSAE